LATEDLLLIKNARDLIEGVNAGVLQKTLEQYEHSFIRMQSKGQTPDQIATTVRSFYYYRAAWISHYASEIRTTIQAVERQQLAGSGHDREHLEAKLNDLIHQLNRYPPDPFGHHLRQGLAGDWSKSAAARKQAGIKVKNHSKRSRLRGLPSDWREQMFLGLRVNSRYRDILAVLSATGARPQEFVGGIEVCVVDSNSLNFKIKGAKTHGGKFGQMERSFTVLADRTELKYLYERVAANAGPLLVTAQAGALSDKVCQLSKKVFPALRSVVSAYVFRHQFSADLKASEMSDVDVSAALGHSVDETKAYYGSARRARSFGGVSDVQCSRAVVERTNQRISQMLGGGDHHERERQR
jgi:integrase